jgi:hypothetical protein
MPKGLKADCLARGAAHPLKRRVCHFTHPAWLRSNIPGKRIRQAPEFSLNVILALKSLKFLVQRLTPSHRFAPPRRVRGHCHDTPVPPLYRSNERDRAASVFRGDQRRPA